MAGSEDSGSKTENATPKKLRDARKKGDVAKSKDMTSTIGMLFSFGVVWIAASYTATHVAAIMIETFSLKKNVWCRQFCGADQINYQNSNSVFLLLDDDKNRVTKFGASTLCGTWQHFGRGCNGTTVSTRLVYCPLSIAICV